MKTINHDEISNFHSLNSNIIEFWQCVATQAELSGFVIDHFLGILGSSCLYEFSGEKAGPHNQNIATHQPFAIFCALNEILQGNEIHAVSHHYTKPFISHSFFPIKYFDFHFRN